MTTSSRPKTDYAGHDRTYRRLRERGQKGWSTDVADNDGKRAWVRAVMAAHWPDGAPRALFLGCGAGEFVIDAARAGADAVGIDIAPTAIEMAVKDATEEGVGCAFHVGSVLALPFADASFDLAVDDHCFHCIIGDDRKAFLAEARRVLRPGGVFLLRSMCSVPQDDEVARQFDPVTRCTVVHGIATRHFGTVRSLRAEVDAAGFRVLAQRVLEADQDGSDMLEIEAERS